MGEDIDKSLLPFGGFDTMIEYQYHKLSKLFKKVYISSKTNKFNFSVDILYDDEKTYSPIIALNSIFSQIEDEKVFIMSVDTPVIQNETIQLIIKNSNNHIITLPNDGKYTHNLCGVYNKKVKVIIQKQLEKDIHKLGSLIKNSPEVLILPIENKKQFQNINTINDYNQSLDL